MKAVILAGGRGSRISEETSIKPKPMLEIGGKPILWHIMKFYSAHGINDFVICCGYLGYVIKEYFANYFVHTSDVTFDLQNNEVTVHQRRAEPWRVTLVDTGIDTMTGGRLKRVSEYLGEEDFCFTYGDGLSDVNVGELMKNHRASGKLASGLPVISNRGIGDLDEMIENDKVGALIDDFSLESYLKSLKQISELRASGNLAEACKESAKSRFDLEKVGGEKYRSLYRRLLSQKG